MYTYIPFLLNLPPKWVNFMACKLYLNKTVKNTFFKKWQSISNPYTKWFIWLPFISEIIQFAKIWVINALSESMHFVKMHTCMNVKVNEKLLIYFSGSPQTWIQENVLSHFSRVGLFVILWTVACQAPLSMGFSRQEHWSGLPFPAPGDLPNSGIKSVSLKSPAMAGRLFITSPTWWIRCKESGKYLDANKYLLLTLDNEGCQLVIASDSHCTLPSLGLSCDFLD